MPAPSEPGADTTACADELAEIVLPDHDGHEVTLGELWRDGPVALVWLRHYG
jgi:hypothetical protein